MSTWLKELLSLRISENVNDRWKLFFLSMIFLIIFGCFTVMRTIKDSVFVSIVGREYLPYVKIYAIFILIPAILLYSQLVDNIKRSHLLSLYSIVYGVGGLLIAYFIGDPVIGLPNTVASGSRLFGWFAYFFLEGMTPFLVGVMWAFSSSVNRPDEAQVNYPLMVAASKIGGILLAGSACLFLNQACDTTRCSAVDVYHHQVVLAVSSLLLFAIPLILFFFMKKVPGYYLHGYEAVYRLEKQKAAHEGKKGFKASFSETFAGLRMLIRYPYSLGIFGVVFFWEIINFSLNLERVGVAQRTTTNMAGQTSFMLYQDFWVHVIGLGIVFVGTRTLFNLLGERRCLLLMPLLIGFLVLSYLAIQSAALLTLVFVLTRSLNYAFAVPLRESLYIPTTKDIKFKTKSWIDAFGVRIAKGIGGSYSIAIAHLARSSGSLAVGVGIGFFSILFSLWFVVAHFLGRRFERAIAKNEVIGE